MNMILYIYGEDTYRSRIYLRQIKEEFKKQRDPQGYNVVIIDALDSPADKILGELFASPFLAERRLVVLENVLSGDQDLQEKLMEIVKQKSIPESIILAVWQGEKIGKAKIAKTLHDLLVKEKYAREFSFMNAGEFIFWARAQFAGRQTAIGSAALNFFCANTAHDSWFAWSLLEQLCAYTNGKEITLGDIRLFLDIKADDNIFGMTDAVAAGNLRLAVRLMADQRRLGKDDGYLFAMILRQFKILLQVRDYLDRNDNVTSDVMAKNIGIHPFVIKKSLAVAKKYRLIELRRIYDELLQIDIWIKTGRGEQGTLLDLFLAKHGV